MIHRADQYADDQRSSQLAQQALRGCVANISSEIRTPLHYIANVSKLMLNEQWGALTEKQKVAITEINKQSKHAASALHELLAMCDLVSGELVLNVAEIDLGEFLEHMLVEVDEHWLIQNLDSTGVVLNVPDGLPKIRGDSSKIQQALIGILSKSILEVSYDSLGEILLDVSYEETSIIFNITVRAEDTLCLFKYEYDPRLFFLRSIVESHNGWLRVERPNNSNLEIKFALPTDERRSSGK